MPRRIPDFPDVFNDLNQVCTYGSYLSLAGVVIFVWILYKLFTEYEGARRPNRRKGGRIRNFFFSFPEFT